MKENSDDGHKKERKHFEGKGQKQKHWARWVSDKKLGNLEWQTNLPWEQSAGKAKSEEGSLPNLAW